MTLVAKDPRHGTVNGYTNHACRCDACRGAWRRYHLDYTHRSGRHLPMADHLATLTRTHGLASTYRHGCRCRPCTVAASEHRARLRNTGTVSTHNASGYSNGCRCDVCREANRLKAARRRERLAAA